MRKIFEKSLKAFGFLYFLLNAVIFVVVTIMVTSVAQKRGFSSEVLILVVPGLGMLAGSWIRGFRFGIWRSFVIALSLLITGAIFFILFYVSPILEKTAS